jgi:hypothetical protein
MVVEGCGLSLLQHIEAVCFSPLFFVLVSKTSLGNGGIIEHWLGSVFSRLQEKVCTSKIDGTFVRFSLGFVCVSKPSLGNGRDH